MPTDFAFLAREARRLLICDGVLDSDAGHAMVQLLEELAEQAASPAIQYGRGGPMVTYARLFRTLAREVELSDVQVPGNAWQRHLLLRLFFDDNPYSQKVRGSGQDSVGPALVEAMRHDLVILCVLFHIDPEVVVTALQTTAPPWEPMEPLPEAHPLPSGEQALAEALLASCDWPDLLPRLTTLYARHGVGTFARHRAFRWIRDAAGGRLEGIAQTDPIQLADLVGYESERRLLEQNTVQFLAGYSANNVLLYGDRGTGKSSTVKALLNAYGDSGLRMVEVSKSGLDDFSDVIRLLRGRPERFIIFIDDLSFEEHETHYKELKAILEGSLEARPDNVLLYATSNRRHLIKERFADRAAPSDDEVHAQDTLQEKLSLADRFGIVLTFLEPNQDQYLEIVEALASRRRLTMSPVELRRRALQWALWHNGRSGRSARQFIDQITGERDLADLQDGDVR